MSHTKQHKDVEFVVDDYSGKPKIFKSFDEACAFAVVKSISNGEDVELEVLIYSKAGAKAWGGDDAVERYEEDPDVSVSQRILIKAKDEGRIA